MALQLGHRLAGHGAAPLGLENIEIGRLDFLDDVLEGRLLLRPGPLDTQFADFIVPQDFPSRENRLGEIQGPVVVVPGARDDFPPLEGHGRGLVQPRVAVRRAQGGKKIGPGALAARLGGGDALGGGPDDDALPFREIDALLEGHLERRAVSRGLKGNPENQEKEDRNAQDSSLTFHVFCAPPRGYPVAGYGRSSKWMNFSLFAPHTGQVSGASPSAI